MNELKEKALAKMLDEMTNKHSQAEDAIHNWLSEQEDTKLLEGVIDANKSIKEAHDIHRITPPGKLPLFLSGKNQNQNNHFTQWNTRLVTLDRV